jgi:hypothetical protein
MKSGHGSFSEQQQDRLLIARNSAQPNYTHAYNAAVLPPSFQLAEQFKLTSSQRQQQDQSAKKTEQTISPSRYKRQLMQRSSVACDGRTTPFQSDTASATDQNNFVNQSASHSQLLNK